ncbi:MAG: type IV secretory system conjugative DNA transfer family protein [Planctomycetales bacterium]
MTDELLELGWRDILFVSAETFRKLLPTAFQRCAYDLPQIEDSTRTATAFRSTQSSDLYRTQSRTQAVVCWRPKLTDPPSVLVGWKVDDISGGRRTRHPAKGAELGEALRAVVGAWLADERIRVQEALPYNLVVGPGESLPGPFTGTLRDYGGCAVESELHDLTEGWLPLGTYAFGESDTPERVGAPLYLARFRNQGRMEHNGVLVCAPQNSGKTRLIIRWAKAASRATPPYATFLIDVKGNLRQKLENELIGDIYYFSTDPQDEQSDRINFLDGPMGLNAMESDRIRQLVTALMPSRGWTERGGQDEYFYRNRVIWLTAFVHLLKQAECYYPEWFTDDEGEERHVDLGDLYDLVADEERVYFYLNELTRAEEINVERGDPVPECGVAHWGAELALLLNPQRVSIGQRPDKETFRTYTTGLLAALEPFSRHGTLHHRVRGYGPGRQFDLESVLDGAPRPVTVILSARQQDLEKADAVLSMTMRRLQWFLFDRMADPQAENRPVLLLLDETRRIRDFNAAEYITFAREARTSCVLVYQALDQIGEPARITELLENIGTQIYLGSLVGNTARYFIGMLPKRWRPTYSRQIMRTANTETTTTLIGHEMVDYFSTTDLFHLPAGRWPALICLGDQPRRKPFLTDMSEDNPGNGPAAMSATIHQPAATLAPRRPPAPWESGWAPRIATAEDLGGSEEDELVISPPPPSENSPRE